MSRDYITKEFTAITADKNLESPLNFAMASAWVIGNFKGVNLKILDLREISGICDYFIIGSASNPVQATAMAEEISHQMRLIGNDAISREGLKVGTDWILLDYGDIIIHVFSETARNIYDLDNLYNKANPVEIPESYYFSTPENERQGGGSDDRSFF